MGAHFANSRKNEMKNLSQTEKSSKTQWGSRHEFYKARPKNMFFYRAKIPKDGEEEFCAEIWISQSQAKRWRDLIKIQQYKFEDF